MKDTGRLPTRSTERGELPVGGKGVETKSESVVRIVPANASNLALDGCSIAARDQPGLSRAAFC